MTATKQKSKEVAPLGHIILNTYLLYSRWLFVPVRNQI